MSDIHTLFEFEENDIHIPMMETGYKEKKPGIVQAQQLDARSLCLTSHGTMAGMKGDWLITNAWGEQYLCPDQVFRDTFEFVDGGDRLMSFTPDHAVIVKER